MKRHLLAGLTVVTMLASMSLLSYAPQMFGQGAPVFYPDTDGPHYVLDIDDGCAEWASNVLTSTGSACAAESGSSFDYLFPSDATTTLLAFDGGLTSASTTLTGPFVFANATGTAATTTNLAITNITSSLLKTNASGSVIPAVLGTDYQNFGYPFPANGTSTNLQFNGQVEIHTLTVANTLAFDEVNGTTWPDFCTAITGGAGLCDGTDADTTYTAGDALTLTGNDIDFDGGASPAGDLGGTWANPSVDDDSHAHTGATISGLDISDDTDLTAGDGLTLTDDDLDCDTASASVFGCLSTTNWSTFNNKVSSSSLSATFPLAYNSSTGAFTFGGLSTSTAAVVGNIPYFSGVNTFANVATSSATINSPLSGSLTVIGSGHSLSIANAAADGSTKGAASFTANDFDASSGNISLDYTNGQKASGSQHGFLSSTDWSTFNSKESALTFSYPLSRSTNTISLAFGTTTSNTWAGTQTFGNLSTTNATTTNLHITGLNCSSNSNGGALTADANGRISCSDDDSGGAGGTANSKWATSTNGLFIHPNNTAMDIALGSNATSSAPFWFDVSATTSYIGNGGTGDSTVTLGPTSNEWSLGYDATDKTFAISSSTALGTTNALTIDKSLAVTLAGSLTVSGANITFGGDTFDELVGDGLAVSAGDLIFDCSDVASTGLSCSGEDLTVDLGTSITSSEITDNEIIEPDLSADNAPSDRDILTYDSTGTNFNWESCTSLLGAGLCDGTDDTGAGGGEWPFTPSSYAGVANQSTTTPFWLKNTQLIASSTLANNATTTSLYVTGLTSALSLFDANGQATEYTGIDCTNQFVRDVSAAGAGTCATVGAADVSLANLTATDTTLTFSGTYNGSTARTIGVNQGASFAWTGNQDFGGAAFLEIPNGTAPTANDPGEIAHDTTDNQLIVDDFVIPTTAVIWSRTIGSTSPAFISGGLMPLPTRLDGFTITRIQCHVLSGTSKVIAIEDASANSSEDITCGTTNTTDDGTITNATFTASELAFIDFGATSGTVDYVNISVFGTWTRE